MWVPKKYCDKLLYEAELRDIDTQVLGINYLFIYAIWNRFNMRQKRDFYHPVMLLSVLIQLKQQKVSKDFLSKNL